VAVLGAAAGEALGGAVGDAMGAPPTAHVGGAVEATKRAVARNHSLAG
jgi:hypothetical protein